MPAKPLWPRNLGLMKPVLQDGISHNSDAGIDAELLHRISFVSLDRLNRQIHALCDLFVAVTEGDKTQDLGLAIGEGVLIFAADADSSIDVGAHDLVCTRGI